MKKMHNTTDPSKVHCTMDNGQSMYIVAECTEEVRKKNTWQGNESCDVPKQFSCITCKKLFSSKEAAEEHIFYCIHEIKASNTIFF
jgi:hypothetical protein